MSKPSKGTAVPSTANPSQQKRVYRDQVTFDHDLYRLKTETLVRNVSWNKKPMWEPFEHKHFFHTFDSDGRKQTLSTPALGHFHEMTVTQGDEGMVPTVTCGPAMEWKWEMDEDGNQVKVMRALQGKSAHDHETEWVISERLRTRQVNQEAAKAQNNIANAQASGLSPGEVRGAGARPKDKPQEVI